MTGLIYRAAGHSVSKGAYRGAQLASFGTLPWIYYTIRHLGWRPWRPIVAMFHLLYYLHWSIVALVVIYALAANVRTEVAESVLYDFAEDDIPWHLTEGMRIVGWIGLCACLYSMFRRFLLVLDPKVPKGKVVEKINAGLLAFASMWIVGGLGIFFLIYATHGEGASWARFSIGIIEDLVPNLYAAVAATVVIAATIVALLVVRMRKRVAGNRARLHVEIGAHETRISSMDYMATFAIGNMWLVSAGIWLLSIDDGRYLTFVWFAIPLVIATLVWVFTSLIAFIKNDPLDRLC